jgi:hypothetical protein
MGYDEKPEILADFDGFLPDAGILARLNGNEKRARS